MRRLRGSAVAVLALAGALGTSGAGAQELTVLLNPKSVDNPFFLDARDGCQAGAKQFNAKCEFNGTTESDVAKQVQFLENRLSAGKLSCAAISANDVAPLVPVIGKYEAAGIPVLTWDSDVEGSKRRAFIGIDSKDAGRQAGTLLLKFFPKRYKPKGGGSKIQIAIGTGGLGAPNLNDRIAGFREVIDKDGRFQVVAGSPFPDDDDVGKAIKVLQDVLAANPKLDGFFISNTLVYFSPAFESTLKTAGRIKPDGTTDSGARRVRSHLGVGTPGGQGPGERAGGPAARGIRAAVGGAVHQDRQEQAQDHARDDPRREAARRHALVQDADLHRHQGERAEAVPPAFQGIAAS